MSGCIGRFFRYRESFALTVSGGYRMVAEFNPLKRMSCPGCAECGAQVDLMRENGASMIEIEGGVRHGDVCQLGVKVDSYDRETGQADDAHVVLRVAQR